MSPRNGTTDGGASPAPTTQSHDPKGIEELIERRRADLAATLDELMARAHPKEIARRSAADVKDRVQAFVFTPDGVLRTERLAAVAGATATLVGLILLLHSRRGRSR